MSGTHRPPASVTACFCPGFAPRPADDRGAGYGASGPIRRGGANPAFPGESLISVR